ncbi:MAG: T9SS type A sorting domain-containing protein [Bacteroidales bacterium]
MRRFLRNIMIAAGVIACNGIIAQELVSSGGDDFSVGSLQVSWSLGEPVIETYDFDGKAITQGLHQPGLHVSSLFPSSEPDTGVEVYPNPVNNLLIVSFNKPVQGKAKCKLFDQHGKPLSVKSFNKGKEGKVKFSMGSLPPGQYILLVITTEGKKSFSVVKQ